MFDITGSIVLYKNSPALVKKAIASFLNTKLNVRLYLIDHSPNEDLKFLGEDDRIEYIANPLNPGFGAGHNVAIRKAAEKSKFHAVINPDIYYNEGVIEPIIDFFEQYPRIGTVMPKILYPDGRTQYLAKLLPTPLDFIVRRFIPFDFIRNKIDNRFELRKSGYNRSFNVPFLSGCFIIFRTSALLKIGAFDENIFMYTEDIDICRRIIDLGYRCMFFPSVSVYHDHERKSFVDFKIFKIYLKSAIYYFNKWGWFFDRGREKINHDTLKQFSALKGAY
ncbi:MAG: glycosyltransferase family 2 protein [Mucilaginibacter sp.]|uniref:glycosyltransferase family 2 protein n=1 Tax=Mucilaginibacter sp. TaxID=1882438 RepID=UPI0034E4F0AB